MIPGPIHKTNCRAAPAETRIPSMQRCTCGSIRLSFEPSDLAEVLVADGYACLVQPTDTAPFWVERTPLIEATPPEDLTLAPARHRLKPHLRMPPDYITIETALGGAEIKYPRRRRAPRLGELVYIRTEMKERLRPWRLLAFFYEDGKHTALLVDPALRQDIVLSLIWSQQRTVCIETDSGVKPEILLVPCYPLPDGTPDPGWTDPLGKGA